MTSQDSSIFKIASVFWNRVRRWVGKGEKKLGWVISYYEEFHIAYTWSRINGGGKLTGPVEEICVFVSEKRTKFFSRKVKARNHMDHMHKIMI